MILLFPSYPSDINQPDPAFAREKESAKRLGFPIGYVDIEFMFGGEPHFKLPKVEDTEVMYRGWILKQSSYQAMADALTQRGLKLVNSPEQYHLSQTLPLWYPILKDQTPESIWIPGETFTKDQIDQAVSTFGDSPVMIKDYMKSRKQDWFDACYIQSASDNTEVHRVTKNFLDLQGETLVGGLVYRKFIALEQIGIHAKIKMPLINEWRIFVLNGKVIDTIPYWQDAEYSQEAPTFTIPNLDIPFYSLDIAKTLAGEWIIIEIGDGGSSGIPEHRKPKDFYNKLKDML
jgi:hypothetical protein